MNKTPKYECSVYNEPKKRFSKEGCITSSIIGINYDPSPGDPFTIHKGSKMSMSLFWPPRKCSDGRMTPHGIEECSYVWNKEISEYEGECNQCGQCCLNCKFLRKVKDGK